MLVKTYPNPSRSMNEVVCTAGVDEDGRLTRLFPIPFRTLDEGQRFAKWQWISADVTKAKSDARAESFKVDVDSISVEEKLPAGKLWNERWKHVEHLVYPSLEALQATGATMGLIKPLSYELTFDYAGRKDWDESERARLIGTGNPDLFGKAKKPLTLLEKIPVIIRYAYRCQGDVCSGHEQFFEDWEVAESWRSWRHRYATQTELEAALRQTYADRPRIKDNLYLFVGTMASRPNVWLVIGHLQPAHLAKKSTDREP